MSKNTIIILVIIIVLIVGGIIIFSFLQKEKIPSGEQSISEEEFSEKSGEAVGLSATVSSVDVENNFLMVKPENKENEIKAIIGEGTRMIKLGLPTDP